MTTPTFFWPLAQPDSPIEVPALAPSGSTQLGVVPRRGVLLPFRRDGISDFASASGPVHTASKVLQVLGTQAGEPGTEDSGGELPWRGGFGSRLHLIRFRNNDAVTEALAGQYVRDALAAWLPDVRVRDVTLGRQRSETGQDTVLAVLVRYHQVVGGRAAEEGQVVVALPGAQQ